MEILRKRYGSQNSIINVHRKILMGGMEVTDTIADFESLSNDLKSFSSVLKHYKVTSEYFSREVVKDILERRISKFSSREFTGYMNLKGYINNPVEYLPKLTDWINEKNIFWRTDLGSNILALYTPKNRNKR